MAASDKEILDNLFLRLQASIPADLHEDLDEFVDVVSDLPPGLRAMASTYQLDVSMALDDLGWHFANWHHRGYSLETSRGLKELETGEIASIFDRGYSIAGHEWDRMSELLNEGFDVFATWYRTSELEATLMPLNRQLWDLLKIENASGQAGLFRYLVAYARKYPERLS